MALRSYEAVPAEQFYGSARPSRPKTPENLTSSLLQDTPLHQRLSSKMPQTSTNIILDYVFIEAAVEMKGKFWGPVGVEEFFGRFLNVQHPTLPNVDYEKLNAVSQHTNELDMYDPFIKAVKRFCKGIKLVNTSAVEDPKSNIYLDRCIKPGIGIYDEGNTPEEGECITQAKLMTGFGEFKNDLKDEPFPLKQPFTPSKQILRYADADPLILVLYQQKPLSILSLESKLRDYTKTDWLPMFFWRLSHANKKARGFDTTVDLVEDETESQNARRALGLKEFDDLHKIPVTDDVSKETTHYIVSIPMTNNHIYPVGRGTRCFKAYDCQTAAVVLLKDTWRVLKYEPEGSIYRELHEAGVRHIAKLIAAGDVGHMCGQTEYFTVSQQEAPPRTHIHYRLVLDIVGTPLTHFSSTWQMVNAMNCALIAHWDAVTKAKILHRDISSGNIIIVGQEGILIDWELCKRITKDPEPARSHEKTGTFQFISARLLMDETLRHGVGDDLESFVHVLTWIAVKYAQNTLTAARRTHWVKGFEASYGGVGGIAKSDYLSGGKNTITRLGLKQEHFSAVLKTIIHGFGHRYGSEAYNELMGNGQEAAATAEMEKLETHDWLCNVVEEALNDEQWKAAEDGRVNQRLIEDQRNLTAAQEKKRKSAIPELVNVKEEEPRTKRSRHTRA